MNRFLADFVFLVHVAYILFAVFGALLVFKWRWVRWIHIPAVIWAAFVELTGRICPLTPWENWLREMGGQPQYSGGFIEHYLAPLVYPEFLTRPMQAVLGIGVIVLNAGLYVFVEKRGHARSR
jgi:hypothetical protein